MNILNGYSTYIKPNNFDENIYEQFDNCLSQLLKLNSHKQMFKLNFFVDTTLAEEYEQIHTIIHSQLNVWYGEEVLKTIIAQAPLTSKILVEVFYFDETIWETQYISTSENNAILFTNNETEILVGNIQANAFNTCQENTEYAFADIKKLLKTTGFAMNSIIRQWNYVENILDYEGKTQRYQTFNDIRSNFYGDEFQDTGYPAATGIGMNLGGLIIEFIAVKSNNAISKMVDNPDQIPAHVYSDEVLVGEQEKLKTTPKFERARYFQHEENKMVYISGTASIIGEQTVGLNSPEEQTEVTIQNLRRLHSDEALKTLTNDDFQLRYGYARVYVKNRKDFAAIRHTFIKHFGNLPVAYVVADICRDNLLVEIEGKVMLN